MVGDIFLAFLLQVLFTIGLIVIFGFLIALCNKRFYANFGSYGSAVCYITGAIGTPIHECAHALFCIIFGHRITEIKLFQINSDDGTLGYVNHSYNPKNIYQRIGNFFIGVAPITVISALLFLLAYFLVPSFVKDVSAAMNVSDISSNIGNLFMAVLGTVQSFFLCFGDWRWWVFVVIGMFLALHMTLSGADIKGALSGVALLLVVLLAADFILGFVDMKLLNGFTEVVMQLGGYLMCFLVLSFVISCIALLVSFVFRAIRH